MPRKINPVRARRTDEKNYERRLRRTILNPLYTGMRSGLATAAGAAEALRALDSDAYAPDLHDIPEREVSAAMEGMREYHQRRLISTFRSALGVDIKPVLLDPPVQAFMRQKFSENVDLIKTIPSKFHAGLKNRLVTELETNPFDRQRLQKLLSEEYKSSGYNLRRLTRDQTTKTIGGLTEIRHGQLGIAEYEWSTSADIRVRPSHAANNGLIFRWDAPPAATGHPGEDVQCRCVPIPRIPSDFGQFTA